MLITISPYDLTSRAPSAMAALLLADEAATLVPAPLDAPDGPSHDAGSGVLLVNLGVLIAKWAWSLPLWRAGVVSPGLGGVALLEEVERVRASILGGAGDSALRRIVERYDRAGDAPNFYDAISRDILRSGTEPGVSVPIAVALERFAGATGSLLARAPAASITERIEERGVRGLMGVAVPCVLGASGEGLLIARQLLAPALDPFRASIDEVLDIIRSGGDTADQQAEWSESVEPAARELVEHFKSERSAIMQAEGDDCRPTMMMVTIGIQPGGTAMRSAMRAADAVMPARGRARERVIPGAIDPSSGDTTLAEAGCLTMSVRRLPWDI